MPEQGPTIKPHNRGGFYTTKTFDGKKKFIYGKSEDEVQQKYNDLIYLYNRGYNISDNPSLKDYAIRWYNVFKKDRKKKNGEPYYALKTLEMYCNAINVHIIPEIGKKKIKEVGATDIQSVINKASSSKSLQHKVRITLKQIFKKAMADKLIDFNPVEGTERIETDEPERLCYSKTQRELLYIILKGHKMLPLAHTILNTGMRVTEAIALMRKRDLFLADRKIKVHESTEFEESKPRRKETKTKRGVRIIPVSSNFAAWMEDYLKGNKSFYVFPGHHNRQMGQTELKNIQRRANKKITEWFNIAEEIYEKHQNGENLNEKEMETFNYFNALLEDCQEGKYRFKLHFKTLRHTYCTELFDLGIDEVSAASIMGHTVEIMRGIYTHIQKERKIITIEKIDGLYGEKAEVVQLFTENNSFK